MEKFPGAPQNKDEKRILRKSTLESQYKKLANSAVAMSGVDNAGTSYLGGENPKDGFQAIGLVRDHFPEDISPKEHFEYDNGPNPLQTEEDFKEAFDLFLQEELVPIKNSNGSYNLNLQYRPYEETVRSYLAITEGAIRDISGESKKLPKTDVAIYLDKSARPVSWFVNELWEDVTDQPKPRTEYLAIDRNTWFDYFKLDLGFGEYIKGSEDLAGWNDLPVHDVKQDELNTLRQLFKEGTVTHEELKNILNGNSYIDNRIRGRAIDAVFKEEDVNGKIQRGEITNVAELDAYKEKGLERVKILNNIKRLHSIYDAMIIASRLRGLFVPGGLTEDDIKSPERIMDYPVDMDGKNITIIDEVERSGTTGEIAKHFISWAFPEAASVNFYVFYKAEKLYDIDSPMNGQLLKIPFWYPLSHDDGTGRGILDVETDLYEEIYKDSPNNVHRAANYGSRFLGVPLEYEMENKRKSLRFREQIARLRVEHEKGHI